MLISQTFFPDARADGLDVRRMKKALNRLGYYTPMAETGITAIPDRAMFDALKNFQRGQNLPVTGQARPEDKTIRALEHALNTAPDGYYLWRSVEDGKVRAAHAQYSRTIRRWSDAPDPGEDFNCRCWAEPVKDAIEPVYPEAFLLPLLGIARLYTAWNVWRLAQFKQWTLGKHKSDTRWSNQFKNRDWTPEQISRTIEKGDRYPAPNKVNPDNKAVRYEYDGRYVVRDETTKEILQVSKHSFKRPRN